MEDKVRIAELEAAIARAIAMIQRGNLEDVASDRDAFTGRALAILQETQKAKA